MSFNFSLNEVKPSNSTKYLKAYEIYKDVTLDGVEVKRRCFSKRKHLEVFESYLLLP